MKKLVIILLSFNSFYLFSGSFCSPNQGIASIISLLQMQKKDTSPTPVLEDELVENPVPSVENPVSLVDEPALTPKGVSQEVSSTTENPAIESVPESNKIENTKFQSTKQYFVQLTALSKYSNKIIDQYSKYAIYGNIYKVEMEGISKIRIGSFAEVNEAVAVLNLIKKNGLKDAFIVGEIVDPSRTTLIIKSTSSNTNVAEPKSEQPAIKKDIVETGKYKIRVAEYKAPDWFDVSKISDLGNIEHWTKGSWTIIVLGNYNNENTATEVVTKLKARGFKDAYIVVEDNGKLYRN